ncbi:MAG: hypothetical protein U9R27_01790 [Campylobacterota bacterium]|nr:hypothetical protein [Campylobacterota bacterium]
MKRIVILSFSAALIVGLTGCAQQNMTDSQRTKAEGTGVGVVGGALLGAAIGGRRGAAWGATLGGAAGYAYGSHVANEKAKYARKEDWLNACIYDARKVNRNTRAYNAKLSNKIAETKRLARLYRQNKVSRTQMRRQKQMIDRERVKANKALKDAQYQLKAQRGVLRDAKRMGKRSEASRLEQEIRVMEQQNSQLRENTNALASVSALAAV